MAAAVQARWEAHEVLDDKLVNDVPELNRQQRDRIGERLRQMYEALQDEPLSPRLEQLLERLTQSQPE